MADPKPPLTYERPVSGPVPRWQFRLLLLLVLLNLGITIQMAYAPGVGAAARRWWAERQAKRQLDALRREARAWSQPAGTVVWEEDPDAAARLLAAGSYVATPVPAQVRFGSFPFLAGWPRGAAAAPPPFASRLQGSFPIYDDQGNIPQQDDGWAVVLLHGLKSPAGTERVVYVIVEGRANLNDYSPRVGSGQIPTEPQNAFVERKLRLIAVALQCDDAATSDRPQLGQTTQLIVAPGGNPLWKAPWRWTPAAGSKPADLRVEPVNRFRFYAGQPNPADPSHFTITYELDGAKSTIDGRLKDDGTVELKPLTGTVTGNLWDPRKPTQ